MMRRSHFYKPGLPLSLLAGYTRLTSTQQRTLAGDSLGAVAGNGVSALSGGHTTISTVFGGAVTAHLVEPLLVIF